MESLFFFSSVMIVYRQTMNVTVCSMTGSNDPAFAPSRS